MPTFTLPRGLALLPWAFFALIFLVHTFPMGMSDFWWHMNTGRWIWEHMALPLQDPFLFTTSIEPDIRRETILRAYALGQLSYYGIFSLFGIWGLLIYKSTLLTLAYWLAWRFLCYKRVQPIVALILISPLPYFFVRFDELRPQLFTFVAITGLLFLIEKTLERLRNHQQLAHYWILLPVTLLIWANLHRGYTLGWVMLATYLGVELVKHLRGKNALQPAALKQLTILFIGSIAISLFNPNGLNAIIANVSEVSGGFAEVIDEYFPLLKHARLFGTWQTFYGCLAIAGFSAFFMLRQWRKVEPAHALLFIGVVFEGLSGYRFSFLLGILALTLGAPYYADFSQRLYSKAKPLVWTLGLFALTGLGYLASQRTALIYGPIEQTYFPDKAADFIKDNHLPGNMFNAFEYGGYLGWKLYPDYPLFIDQRNLDFNVHQQYTQVWRGDYRAILNQHQVNTVMFYVFQPLLGRLPPLDIALLQDNEWQLVYIDPLSIIFVRASMNPGVPVYDKGRVIDYMLKKGIIKISGQ